MLILDQSTTSNYSEIRSKITLTFSVSFWVLINNKICYISYLGGTVGTNGFLPKKRGRPRKIDIDTGRNGTPIMSGIRPVTFAEANKVCFTFFMLFIAHNDHNYLSSSSGGLYFNSFMHGNTMCGQNSDH